jgi:hypothetical protein
MFFKNILLPYIGCIVGIPCDISVYANNVLYLGSPPPSLSLILLPSYLK